MKVLNNGKVKMWTDGVPVEAEAVVQINNIAGLPFIHKHVAIMPDVHFGKGATIGSVIPTIGAVIPAAVGVDLGCGMIAQRTDLTASDLPDSLSCLRSLLEQAIPHGRTNNGQQGDRGAWHNVPNNNLAAFATHYEKLHPLVEKHCYLERAANKASTHLGTLGTGNHFVEVCLDEEQRVWIMLHSGSRGIGNTIGTYFIDLAKKDMAKYFINLPDKDLSYFPEHTEHFNDYVKAVSWAQDFAALNRQFMMEAALSALQKVTRPFECDCSAVNCHHNYVSRETHFGKSVLLTRKGAVSAKLGELGIIPGSMGAKSFIVSGKGNPDSFCSCSHGAGRSMSRTEARKRFTVADHELATQGIECRKDEDVIDETPKAYKDIDAVMSAQSDLVNIVHTLKQVVCVKG